MGKRQHYVPQSYQRGWTENNEGLIWVYRKNQAPKQLSISKKVGMDFYFYGDQAVEDEITAVALEHEAAPILKAIRDRKPITEGDRKCLSRYISVFWRRVPKHKQAVNEMLKGMLPGLINHHRQELISLTPETETQAARIEQRLAELNEIKEEYTAEMPQRFFLQNIKRESEFEEFLLQMDWGFLEVKKDDPYNHPFITSDSPVLFDTGAGLGNIENAIVLFPISKDVLLQAMWITTYKNAYVPIDDVIVGRFNGYIAQEAHREVYASKKSTEIMALVNERLK